MGAIGNFLLPDYPGRTLEGMRRPQQLLYYGGAVPSSFEFKDPGGQLVQQISRLEPKITIWVGGHSLGHLGPDNSQQILGEGRHQRYGLQDLAGASVAFYTQTPLLRIGFLEGALDLLNSTTAIPANLMAPINTVITGVVAFIDPTISSADLFQIVSLRQQIANRLSIITRAGGN